MIFKAKTLRRSIIASLVTFAIVLISLRAVPANPIVGAGSILAGPLFQRYSTEYQKETGTEIQYSATGRVEGINRFIEGSVDFAASDIRPTREERDNLEKQQGLVMLPTGASPVAIIYNLRQVSSPVSLSRKNLVKIFTGKVSSWNQIDPNLPNTDIKVVVRSDRSGINYTLTNYLQSITNGKIEAKALPDWGFDVFASVPESSQVTGEVRRTDGAIGYIAAILARQNSLPIAKIENKKGEYLLPRSSQVSKGLTSERFDENFYPNDEEAPEGYPLANILFLLLHKQYSSVEIAQRMKDMTTWILTKGQTFNEEFKYAKIPEDVTQRAIQVANKTIRP
ncbi:substrate-binding domain-containing protein [Limnofasciculus baicalensis]|uniref:Phosphate-binding protein n=1 Tax=Limnofasciculus baicalensis BBK-W-15 TaxID=2699891 RepID=A0AAE3GRF0_9CYAN|nr:substrate-binding domain-containing protein [Limnofasciculus baicalensis]MCP2727162.1 phosphate ABC transporter substrate-binding protein PstS [Limnofasciculus baicalensis BBK-W-15]